MISHICFINADAEIQRYSVKIVFSTVRQIHKKAPVSEFLAKKVSTGGFIKKTLRNVFSCEFCKSFKNTYFKEVLQIAVNNNSTKYNNICFV